MPFLSESVSPGRVLYALGVSTLIPFLRFLFCGYLFTQPLKRRPDFYSRLCQSLLLMAASGISVVLLRFLWNRHAVHILCRVINYLCILPFIFLCFEEPQPTKLLCWSGCIATQELGEQLSFLLMAAFGTNDMVSMAGFSQSLPWRDLPLYLLFRFVVYYGTYRFFGRTDQIEYAKALTQNIASFSVYSTLILSLMSSMIREFRQESQALYLTGTFFCLLYAFTILIYRIGYLSYGKNLHEKALMEQMVQENKKRYLETKESIDIVNMRCHDLKHRLADIQDKLGTEEIEALRQAIAVYDRNIQTGNDILDVFLNSKQLACQEKQITISCMADGKILSFMSVAHLSSLFGNAIDNAVEAVSQVADPGKRVIDITVHRKGGCAVIHLSNYFSGTLPAAGAATTKADRNHHGFGMKSIKYVADHYGGTVAINIEQDIFTLEVTIPLARQEVV